MNSLFQSLLSVEGWPQGAVRDCSFQGARYMIIILGQDFFLGVL